MCGCVGVEWGLGELCTCGLVEKWACGVKELGSCRDVADYVACEILLITGRVS